MTRSERVVVKALDVRGREVRIRAENDLLAQALEHEINHVNGILYIDQVEDPDTFHRIPDLPSEHQSLEEPATDGDAPARG